jgi:tetratricopeptide (TPR) repeat protein
MNQSPHIVFLLLISMGVIYSHSLFSTYFTKKQSNEKVVDQLMTNLDEERLKNETLQFQMNDFRQEVAAILGNVLPALPVKEDNFKMRSLASVVTIQNKDELAKIKAADVLSKGKTYFRNNDYENAVSQFLAFIKDHSYSAQLPEAYFLLNECFFSLNRWEEVIKITEKMVEIFPENEMTGYALLRAGKVYEMQDKPSQALEIYKTVLRVFPNRNLASQAKISIEATDL